MRTIFFALCILVQIGSGGIGDANAMSAEEARTFKMYPWDLRPRTCLYPGVAEKAGKMCESTDWVSYSETKGRVDQLFASNVDFDILERAETELGFSREKFPSGQYLFDAWYLSLYIQFSQLSAWAYDKLDAWAAAKGEEGYVKLAEAQIRFHEAWRARGSGTANTVSPEAWAIFNRKLWEANQALDSASDKLKEMGPWYTLKLEVAFLLPELENSRASLLDAASDAWPDYPMIYTIPMGFALPKWGGSYEKVDAFARLAIEKSKDQMGASMYPIVYQQMLRFARGYTLADTKVDWSLMKTGFRDIEAQGRASAALWKVYAGLACQMRDREEARRLYEISDKLTEKATAEPPDPCRVFAFSAT